MGIPEDVFWYGEIRFIEEVVKNKVAYDDWMTSTMAKERERSRGKK